MNTAMTTLQVPISIDLRNSARLVAEDSGFSSLQEVVRVILNKFASRQLSLNISDEPVIKLSAKAIKRYDRMDRDFASSKNFKSFSNLEDFLKSLES